ncbi:MAG: hypothetical protein ACP5QO_02080 [Clostridia bacterium]
MARHPASAQPHRTSPFTSDLSVRELVLGEAVGFKSLGLVTGTSLYQMGLPFARWARNQEMTTLSQAL